MGHRCSHRGRHRPDHGIASAKSCGQETLHDYCFQRRTLSRSNASFTHNCSFPVHRQCTVRIMRSSSFDFPSNRNGSSQLKFESPGQFREQISFAAVVHLINKCAFDDECTWAAVRTFGQSKPLQGGLGVAQHVCRTTNHPPIGFWRDSRNAKIIKDLTRRH